MENDVGHPALHSAYAAEVAWCTGEGSFWCYHQCARVWHRVAKAMEGDATLAALISGAIFGVIGYGARSIWDSYIKHQDTIRIETWKIRASQIERRLSQFYWPVYLRLQRDNVVWKRILDRFEHVNPDDEERRKLAVEVERSVIIPNHLEIARTIQSFIHLAAVDKELEDLLMAYLRHVDVYTSLRTAGIQKDPIMFGEPWPKGLFTAIQSRLVACQTEYNEILRDNGIMGSRPPYSGIAPRSSLEIGG